MPRPSLRGLSAALDNTRQTCLVAYANPPVNPRGRAGWLNRRPPPSLQGAGRTFDRLAGLDAVVGEQQRAELARPRPRLPIALGGGHDAALHEDVPLAREGVGVPHAGLLRQGADEAADLRQLTHALA